MANVDIRVGKKDAAFFSANPTLILKDGQFLFNSDTLELFIGDGVTALSALPFLGSGGGGTQNLQEVITESPTVDGPLTASLDGETYISINDNLIVLSSTDVSDVSQISLSPLVVSFTSDDGVNASSQTVNASQIENTTPLLTYNGDEVATVNQIPSISGLLVASNNLSDIGNAVTAKSNLGINKLYITTGNQSNSTTTPASISGLTTASLAANTRYSFSGVFQVSGSGAGGIFLQCNAPTGSTMFLSLEGSSSSVNAFLVSPLITNNTNHVIAFYRVVGTTGFVKIMGEVLIGANAGTIGFSFSSGTGGQTVSVNQLGTFINYEKMN